MEIATGIEKLFSANYYVFPTFGSILSLVNNHIVDIVKADQVNLYERLRSTIVVYFHEAGEVTISE